MLCHAHSISASPSAPTSPIFRFPRAPVLDGSESLYSDTSHSTVVLPSVLRPTPLLVRKTPLVLAAWIHDNPPDVPCVIVELPLSVAGVSVIAIEEDPFAGTGTESTASSTSGLETPRSARRSRSRLFIVEMETERYCSS